MADKRVAVVTGGNRGLGFEVCRQLARARYRVVLTSRDPKKGEEAAAALSKEGLEVLPLPLDVNDPKSIAQLRDELEERFGRVDILVNNAGVLFDASKNPEGASALSAQLDTLRRSMETNVYGPLRLIQELVPLMRRHGYGRIVNVSSDMAQLSRMGPGYPGYRISKVALNALTRILAEELQDANVKVNAVCPGWVRTEMGGEKAPRSVEEGARGLVWAATLPDDGPSGGFFRDGEPLLW